MLFGVMFEDLFSRRLGMRTK